jgi:serine protease Do
VTPLLAKLFRLPDTKGAIITDVMARGSAEKAGLRRGDVVVRYDGREVLDSGRLQNLIGSAPIGSRHRIEVIRDGKPQSLDLNIQEAPRERLKRAQPAKPEPSEHPLGGVAVEELKPAMARQLGLGPISGVVITAVDEGSAAEGAGLQQGDVIVEVNRQPIPNLATYQRLAEPLKPKDIPLLLVNRQGSFFYVPVATE